MQEIYGVDIKDKYSSYDVKGRLMGEGDNYTRSARDEIDVNKQHKEGLVLVYEYYDRKSGLQYCLADGYDDFLREPMAPDVKVEAFYPIFPLVFNEVEHKDVLYPPSDIKLLMPMQNEYNPRPPRSARAPLGQPS